jgi:hypothetical protein
MNEIETIVSTPYPMEGFEGEYLDTSGFYSRFKQIGDFLSEKREQSYIQGSGAASSPTPARGTYYLSKPREDTIEFFMLSHHGEMQPQQLPSPEPTKARATVFLDAFYGVFLSFSLAALKTRFVGEPTRALELSLFASRRNKKKTSEGWIRQGKGRINEVILRRREATSASPEWEKWFQKVEDVLKFEEGWNGDDSPLPEFVAALNATKFLKAMRLENYQPTRIAASAMGGIAVTRRVGSKKVLVECYNNGRVYYLFSDRGSGNMDVQPLLLDQDSLTKFVASMREFLNG